jgi:hypothetical protein
MAEVLFNHTFTAEICFAVLLERVIDGKSPEPMNSTKNLAMRARFCYTQEHGSHLRESQSGRNQHHSGLCKF